MWINRRELARLLREAAQLRKRIATLEAELQAERETARLDREKAAAALDAERERNRLREERLVDRVLTTKGTYAITETPKREAAKPAEERELTAIEEAELEMYRSSAIEQGYGAAIGQRMWERKRDGVSWEQLVAELEQMAE